MALFGDNEQLSDAEIFGNRAPAHLLNIDIPRIVGGTVATPVRGGLSVVGWAIADSGIDSIAIVVDGKRVASARCGLRRPDVAAAHPSIEGSLLSGYAAHLPPKALASGQHQIAVSMRDRAGQVISREFLIVVEEPVDAGPPWALRRKMSQAEVNFKADILASLKRQPTFRVVLSLPASHRALADARRTLESLRNQKYREWMLEVVVSGTDSPREARLAKLAQRLCAGFEDVAERIHLARAPAGKGRTSRKGATEWVMRQVAGDELGCDALLELAVAGVLDPDVDLWYCDERRREPVTGRPTAFFKPDWSPDLLLTTNYLGRSWCANRQLVEKVFGSLPAVSQAGEYDATLRLSEVAHGIGHVAKVLHQRMDGAQAQKPARRSGAAAEKDALADALRRRKVDAKVLAGSIGGYYRIRRRAPADLVSIIIPTCGARQLVRKCVTSLREHTAHSRFEIVCADNIPAGDKELKHWLRSAADVVVDVPGAFNWSKANNLCVSRTAGKFLLFLNDDIEILDPGWLDALLEHAQRLEVGVVGALLLYPNRTVQHAGVFLDQEGRGRHAFRHLDETDPGYFGLAHSQRNVVSVTGACLMTRRATFDELGGFDETHAVINNDLDYCLRARRKGYLNIYTPHARLIHHELASRALVEEKYDTAGYLSRWQRAINLGDPYFNPNLSPDHDQFVPEGEPLETVFAGHPLFDLDSIRRILIVKLDHIGDCINALPAVRRLSQYFPKAILSLLANRATRAIWAAEPAVKEIIELDFFHARSALGKLEVTDEQRRRLQQFLAERRFDLAIDLRKQPDSRDVLQLTGASVLVGFDHQGRFPWLDVALEWDEDVPLRTKHGHVADDLTSLVEALVTHGQRARAPLIKPPEGRFRCSAAEQRRLFARPVICVHPASGSVMRQWPLAKFSQLIDLLLALDRYHVALIGGCDERGLVHQLLEAVAEQPKVFDLVGKFPLEELPKLLARAALFVGNNSGPQHLAAALGTPTVGIHSGVVDAREWGPLGARSLAVRKAMVCSPCFLEHPRDCQRETACLTQLPVRHVYEACLHALSQSPRARGTPC